MKDLMPIIYFEHIQSSNWQSKKVPIDAFEMREQIKLIKESLHTNPTPPEKLLSSQFILDLNLKITSAFENALKPDFLESQEWDRFLVDYSVFEQSCSNEIRAYILTLLFSTHLTRFRLLTAWLIVDCYGRGAGFESLNISNEGLGRLVEHLSNSGSPIFDAEDMRSKFPSYYE